MFDAIPLFGIAKFLPNPWEKYSSGDNNSTGRGSKFAHFEKEGSGGREERKKREIEEEDRRKEGKTVDDSAEKSDRSPERRSGWGIRARQAATAVGSDPLRRGF